MKAKKTIKMSVLTVFLVPLCLFAGQVRQLKKTIAAYTDRGYAIDGDLKDWSRVQSHRLRAVEISESALTGHAVKTIDFPMAKTYSDVFFSYDEHCFYVAIDASDPSPLEEGDSVEIIFGGSVRGRFFLTEDNTVFKIKKDRSGWVSESKVSWKDITGEDRAPAEDFLIVADMGWSGLTTKTLAKLSSKEKISFLHTSLSALSDVPQFRLNPHLPHPKMWGTLVFGGDPAKDNAVIKTPQVVDASRLACVKDENITVDGKLDDWKDKTFTDHSLLGEMLGSRYLVKIATAYDDKNFYAVARFNNPVSDPYNTKPAATKAGFHGGDCLQFRISDLKATSFSACAWYDSINKESAFTIDGSQYEEDNLIKAGAVVAYGRGEKEIITEISIPWKAVLKRGSRIPRRGDEWRMTLQPWWHCASEKFAYVSEISLERPPVKTIRYNLEREGIVSYGVFDNEGRLVRTVAKTEFRNKGAIADPWDLLDQYGEITKPGKYKIKGIVTDGIQAEYKFSVGSCGNPPWPTADGKGDWLSDEAPPQAAATDGENVFFAAPGSEKGFAVMCVDKNGQRIWGVGEEFYPRAVSLSYIDGTVYALWSGPVKTETGDWKRFKSARDARVRGRAVIIAYDAKTGHRVGFSAENPHQELGESWQYREDYRSMFEMIADKSFSPAKYIGQPRYHDTDIGETCNAIGLAALPGKLVVSKMYDNRLEVYDSKTLEKLYDIPLDSPAGLMRLNDEEIIAVSGKMIVKVNVSTKKTTPIVSEGLSAPVALTVDKNGIVYVSDWADQMCVKKFTQDGGYLGHIGKKGGRPWVGKFERGGMLLPHGLAVTDSGSLYVAEADCSPKRISKWSAKTGAFEREWFGPAPYGGGTIFWVDKEDENIVHTQGCSWKLDWDTGKTEIMATEFRRLSLYQPFMPNPNACLIGTLREISKNGKKFLVVTSRNNMTVLRKDGDVFVPCAAVGGLHYMVTWDGTQKEFWDSDIGRHMYSDCNPPFFKGHAGDNYSWADLNGDGLVQENEMKWFPTLKRDALYKEGIQFEYYAGWGTGTGKDFTHVFPGFGKKECCVWVLKPDCFTEYGPVYDIAKAKMVYKVCDPKNAEAFTGTYVDGNGQIALAWNMESIHGSTLKNVVSAITQDGKILWEMAGPQNRSTKSLFASNTTGEYDVPGIGKILCTWNWWWNFRPYFYTADGLYAGTALEETALGPYALWSESINYFFQRKNGDCYIVNGANDSHHFIKLNGLENASRFESEIEVTPEDCRRAQDASTRAADVPDPTHTIVMDGSWTAVDGGKGRSFRISLDKKGKFLEVKADVNDPTPMLQKGTDYRTLFISGDCVDFMFAVNSDVPANRRMPMKGDKRLLFSEYKGRPIAVLYEPVTEPRAAKPHQLMAAKIDRITVLDSAEVSIARREDGYVLDAKVPLKDIGLSENDTRILKGDVGVVFSDAIGGRELRLYHYNKNTVMIADLTSEATLQPHEWGNVVQELGEENIIKNGNMEENLSASKDTGWTSDHLTSGSAVGMTEPFPFAGKKSMRISLAGDGHVSVGQSFKVDADRKYAFRFWYRTKGITPEDVESKTYSNLRVSVAFLDKNGKIISVTCPYMIREESVDWVYAKRGEGFPGRRDFLPFAPPEGTESVILDFKATAKGLKHGTDVWIDKMELCEVK